MTPVETAEAILVAHQRRDVGSCLCGWAELGQSHPAHQVHMLVTAGVLFVDQAVSCSPHRLVQHQDGRPPWCDRCRLDAAGRPVGSPSTP